MSSVNYSFPFAIHLGRPKDGMIHLHWDPIKHFGWANTYVSRADFMCVTDAPTKSRLYMTFNEDSPLEEWTPFADFLYSRFPEDRPSPDLLLPYLRNEVIKTYVQAIMEVAHEL